MANLRWASDATSHWLVATQILTAILFAPAVGFGQPAAGDPRLSCYVGPIKKTFGGNDWLVYSCSDGRSLIIVSAVGNPAMPFVFALMANEEGFRLSGEGTGNKEVSQAAFDALRTLSPGDIAALVAQTARLRKVEGE